MEEALPQAWVLVCSSVAWDLVVQPMGVGQRMEADLDWCSETRTKFDENSNLYFLSAQINSVVH